MNIEYKPQGVCCRQMNVKIEGEKVISAEFVGGCNGNLKGLGQLIKGMSIPEIIEKLKGITCGDKFTSCPDQLSKCLTEALNLSKNIA